ncbi:hypothetical protein D8B26_003757 [Coccidioides posadasii str. Silveira]|uniref:Large ribosomal subunit protein mL50 n=2 Tax=Coccidioides posadasii TaxID=199306 RepID=E9D8R7_COCPS|nr:conserved hypothetical protein [Coccidioides posadasii str. Silveira]KMM69872.1 hypothetical protein CPAG_06185 [Coccidioides posadasii RMSCC 3488]QVM09091.1 hypothetical protein D8B26_003757 [Coccidioides posadasii str. Silveira]
MPSGARLITPLEALPYRVGSARYVCSTCRRQFIPRCTSQPIIHHQTRRHNSSDSNNVPFSEKVRRRIWGTENPPGLKDPYGGESFLEKRAREQREAKAPQPELEPEYVPEAETASVAEVSATEAGEYVPATTWDGLEHVGSSGQWWEQSPTPADSFVAFMHKGQLTTHDEILTALHQTVVELCIMKELNKPFERVCEIWEHEDRLLALINRVEVKAASQPGIDALVFPSETAKAALLEFFRDFDLEQEFDNAENLDESEGPSSVSESHEPSKLAELNNTDLEIRTPENLDFLSLPLEDREFQFAFLKRASQLTGHRIPDPELLSITKVSRLLALFTAASKPKPAKLADILIAEGKFAALPNVKIFDRRQTPIDHEKEVGRWKIIEEELTKRGLPVTGRVST